MSLDELSAPLTALSKEVDDCESFVLDQLGQLDDLRELLTQRERDLGLREEQLAIEAQAFRAQWRKIEQFRNAAEQRLSQVQHEARQVAQARAELAALRESAESPPVVAGGGKSAKGPNRAQLKQWEQDRSRLERDLATTREQVAQLSAAALELAGARRETAELRKQLFRQQHRLLHAKGHFQPQQQGKLRVLEVERECLARELDTAQRQLRDLQDRATREQRQLANERATWAAELQKLREAVEVQMARLHGQATADHSTTSAPRSELGAGGVSSLDGLLGELEQMQAELKRDAALPAAMPQHTK